ncbi:MAG: hypothetical protein AVDCRST_MAG88-363, partial [uncultured Thermomicrobiales bacterium]
WSWWAATPTRRRRCRCCGTRSSPRCERRRALPGNTKAREPSEEHRP